MRRFLIMGAIAEHYIYELCKQKKGMASNLEPFSNEIEKTFEKYKPIIENIFNSKNKACVFIWEPKHNN